ncbi:MAG: UDP-N-acetylmuramyl-tripeptide synthetase [bacterium]|nr:UDP-N-acetylmuramyl-tripeptide synthetase [bacterium]
MEKLTPSLPKPLGSRLLSLLKLPYHYLLAFVGAVVFGFPARKLNVIAVTGTKGKSSVVELISALLDEAGFKTAHASTIHFKIGDIKERNMHKMTMPGRFFLQHFLRKAVHAGCTHAVVEMTSEGARQFRHKFISLDALIFTNLAPEHIESHGSYENYVAAKVSLAKALQKSSKSGKLLVVNGDDKEAEKFLAVFSGTKIVYSKKDAGGEVVTSEGVSFNWQSVRIESSLPGEFNLYNILAAVSFAKASGIPVEKIQSGIKKVTTIKGRAERITLDTPPSPPSEEGGKGTSLDFTVIVDYAHTPDSLEKFYQTYAGKYRRCILGNTGGGRDTWKRPVMAGIAEKYCDEIILTNEDPYDEDPEKIIREMAAGMTHKEPMLILDRRTAIANALQKSSKGDVVLITGKGTDPYIMGPNGSKQVWDDATVVREELAKVLAQRNP